MQLTKLAELRARRALAAAGLDVDSSTDLTRLDSVTNEVWAHGNLLVRVSGGIGTRLRREAMLAAHLPAAVRYPTILAVGDEAGIDWVVMDRAPGEPLVRCWPKMDDLERHTAVSQFAGAVRALHETPAPVDLPEAHHTPHALQLGRQPVAPLLAALERSSGLAHVDSRVIDETAGFVQTLAPSLDPFMSTTLIHGDLHFQNVLWDGQSITALLDLEYARAAPPDLDLDVFLRFCAMPFLFVPVGRESEAQPAHYEGAPFWFREAYPELFAERRILDRLRIFAVAFDVNDLLANPPQVAASQLTRHHPYRRLLATVRGQGHLDLLDRYGRG